MSEPNVAGAEGAAVEEPVVVDAPVVEEPAAAVEEPAGAAADEGAGGKRKHGMLEELIEHRTVRRQLEGERAALAPVLSRLTPELQRAITEGRVMVKPEARSEDGRREQLEGTAKRLNLYTQDAAGNRVLDLEAASSVDAYVRERAQEAVAPLQQLTQMERARKNIDTALAHAEKNGYDVESVRLHYENALRQPNGAALVADPGVAEELWYGAVGRAEANGKGRKGAAAAKADAPPPIPPEHGGRRPGAAGGIQLSPNLQRIYKDNEIDPNKTTTLTRDARGGIVLE